jgi:hypothetical protein
MQQDICENCKMHALYESSPRLFSELNTSREAPYSDFIK